MHLPHRFVSSTPAGGPARPTRGDADEHGPRMCTGLPSDHNACDGPAIFHRAAARLRICRHNTNADGKGKGPNEHLRPEQHGCNRRVDRGPPCHHGMRGVKDLVRGAVPPQRCVPCMAVDARVREMLLKGRLWSRTKQRKHRRGDTSATCTTSAAAVTPTPTVRDHGGGQHAVSTPGRPVRVRLSHPTLPFDTDIRPFRPFRSKIFCF